MLGEYLKRYRINKNLSQKEFGEMIGIRQYLVSLIETGKYKPSRILINRIAKALNLEPEFIRGLL